MGLVLLAGGALTGLYIARFYTLNHRQNIKIYESQVHARQVIFNSTIDSTSEPLQTFAYDYTFWDDMVNLVEQKDYEFAQLNIDPGLATFNADAVWVYSTSGELIYSVAALEEEIELDTTVTVPLQPDQHKDYFQENGVFQYHLKTDIGIFEIYTATIHPTDDADRVTTPRGYFFVGKLIDQEYLASLADSLDGSVELIDQPSLVSSESFTLDEESGAITISRALMDSQNQTLGAIKGQYVATDIKDAINSQDNMLRSGAVLIVALGVALFLAILWWAIVPLRAVQRALNTRNGRFIARLKNRRNEFGDIAQLIEKSFSQQKQLEEQNEIVERQVTERTEELRHEHTRLVSSIDSLEAGLLITSKNGEIVLHNATLLEMFGLGAQPNGKDVEKLSLKLLQGLLPDYDLSIEIDKCLKSGKPFHQPQVSVGDRIYSFAGAPVMPERGEIIGCVVLASDVTEATIMERSKEEFFSIASHELRTPLTSIKGNSSMIMQYFPEAVKDPGLKDMINDIHTSSTQLIGIVNDFLDVSKLEQGKMNFNNTEFALSEVIENVAAEMKTDIASKKLTLELNKKQLDALPPVWADHDHTKQIIYNLLGNAVKFTDKGTITISAAVENSKIKLLISDTGRGIPLENQKLLFHKFQQAGSSLLTRDTTKGTGLGLYISKLLTESMGGSIGLAESAEGQGSTFSLTLPISTTELKKTSHKNKNIDTATGLTEE